MCAEIAAPPGGNLSQTKDSGSNGKELTGTKNRTPHKPLPINSNDFPNYFRDIQDHSG